MEEIWNAYVELPESGLEQELRELRRIGLARYSSSEFPLLTVAAARLASLDLAEVTRRRVETLLKAAFRELGDSLNAEAAAVLFGIAPGTRGYTPAELRRRATELFYDESGRHEVDAFRNSHEKRIIAALALTIVGLTELVRAATGRTDRTSDDSQGGDEAATEIVLTDLLTQLRLSSSLEACLSAAGSFIHDEVFPGRRIRVGFVERSIDDGLVVLRPRFLIPPAATGNSFIYPVTFAAWSLAVGEIVAYPRDLNRECDFKRLKKLGKLDDVLSAAHAVWDAPPRPLLKYLDRDVLRDHIERQDARLGDFYQDWESDQKTRRYAQFLSVPVPIVRRSSTDRKPPEFGVFNIDAMDEAPMLTPAIESKLEFLCEALYLMFDRLYANG